MKTVVRSVLAAALALGLAARAVGADASPPDKTTTEAATMKTELQHARERILAAKKAEDLDPVLFDLQKYENNGFGAGFNPEISPENQELCRQLVNALEFAKVWQSYLSHTASGNAGQARNDLTMLTQNNFGLGIIPRSRLLALLDNPPPPASSGTATPPGAVPEAQQIIDGINSLEDLEPALGKLNDLATHDALARDYASSLAPMVEVYNDLRDGLPTNVNINFMGDVTGPGVSAKANGLLLKFVLQHYFDTYTGPAPTATETPATYAERVKRDALAGRDWPLLKKALTVHSWLFRNVAAMNGLPDVETAGLDDMITGLNQQQAGQYALAVTSFENALKAGSMDIPAPFIGEQLAAIKRDHPAEYDSGIESFLTPPSPNLYPGMNPAMYNNPIFNNPAFRQRYRPPNYPGNPNNQPNPMLNFPGAKTSSPPPTTTPPATK